MSMIDKKLEHHLEHLAATFALESERTRDAMASAFTGSIRGLRVTGALARPIVPNAVNYTAGGRLVGWSVRAQGGEVVLNLYDAQAPDALRFVGAIDIPTGTSQTVPMMPSGIAFVDSLYVESTGAGTPFGALWIGAVD